MKLVLVCSRIFTATNSDKQQLGKIQWRFASFKTENLIVSLKISWQKNSLKLSPFSSVFSHSKKASNLTIIYPDAVARSSLQSMTTESLMPGSVTRGPLVKFKTLMVLSIGSSSHSWSPSKISDSEFLQLLKGGHLVTGTQKLEEIISLFMNEIHSSFRLLCLEPQDIQSGIIS
jgi:hypothetical protein